MTHFYLMSDTSFYVDFALRGSQNVESIKQAITKYYIKLAMPFKKGQIGNPKGRGTEKEKAKKTAAMLLSPLVQRAVNAIARALESEDDSAWAAKLVMEYVYGKPSQEVNLETGGQKIGILYVGTPPEQK